MVNRYKVWADSESAVDFPMHEISEYSDLESACDTACALAHEHDGKEYRAIFHVEDLLIEETIDTYENILKLY